MPPVYTDRVAMTPLALMGAAALLGVVQGLTEFLPVSSTAHLVVLPKILGWTPPLLNSLAFDVALHVGTLVAVLVVFRRDWARMGHGLLFDPAGRDGRTARTVAIATIPVLAAGAAFGSLAGTTMRSPAWVAVWLLGGAIWLLIGHFRGRGRRRSGGLGYREALLIGAAQALALFPGFSRSGAVIAAGLLLGLSRPEAARFAFMLSAPTIAAAGIWECRHLDWAEPALAGPLLLGVTFSAISGMLVIRWFLGAIARIGLVPFVAYRVLLAAALAIWYVKTSVS